MARPGRGRGHPPTRARSIALAVATLFNAVALCSSSPAWAPLPPPIGPRPSLEAGAQGQGQGSAAKHVLNASKKESGQGQGPAGARVHDWTAKPFSAELYLIGVGCQKCGTNTLNELLRTVPWTQRPRKKELHFFDAAVVTASNCTVLVPRIADAQLTWPCPSSVLRGPDLGAALATATLQAYRKERNWQRWRPHKHITAAEGRRHGPIRFEVTPSYMSHRQTPYAMAAAFRSAGLLHSSVKLVFTLRNPAARAWSAVHQATLGKTKRIRPEAFHELVRRETQILRHCYGGSLSLERGCDGRTGEEQNRRLAECVATNPFNDKAPWFARFTQTSSTRAQNVRHAQGMHEGVVLRGMYVDQVRSFMCAGFQPEQMLFLSSTDVFTDEAGALDWLAGQVGRPRRNVGRPRRNATFGSDPGKHAQRAQMMPETETLLREFYAPLSRALVELLRSKDFLIWRGGAGLEAELFPADKQGA